MEQVCETKSKYIKDRLEDQIEWYDKNQCNIKKIQNMKVVIIILAPAIPILSVLTKFNSLYVTLLIATAGGIITILEGLLSLASRELYRVQTDL